MHAQTALISTWCELESKFYVFVTPSDCELDEVTSVMIRVRVGWGNKWGEDRDEKRAVDRWVRSLKCQVMLTCLLISLIRQKPARNWLQRVIGW